MAKLFQGWYVHWPDSKKNTAETSPCCNLPLQLLTETSSPDLHSWPGNAHSNWSLLSLRWRVQLQKVLHRAQWCPLTAFTCSFQHWHKTKLVQSIITTCLTRQILQCVPEEHPWLFLRLTNSWRGKVPKITCLLQYNLKLEVCSNFPVP